MFDRIRRTPLLRWNGQAHAQNDAAARLVSQGELRAALIASNPVLVTRGADGQVGGVSVELARALPQSLASLFT
jgi:hypothetical protein